MQDIHRNCIMVGMHRDRRSWSLISSDETIVWAIEKCFACPRMVPQQLDVTFLQRRGSCRDEKMLVSLSAIRREETAARHREIEIEGSLWTRKERIARERQRRTAGWIYSPGSGAAHLLLRNLWASCSRPQLAATARSTAPASNPQ